ncbi:MAG: hypothetical protein ACE5GW_00460 [Planctomycetota bacterium]
MLQLADAITLLAYLFTSGQVPVCLDAADANDDSFVDVTDTMQILSGLYGGSPPPAPYPGCGPDPTLDGVLCASVVGCP